MYFDLNYNKNFGSILNNIQNIEQFTIDNSATQNTGSNSATLNTDVIATFTFMFNDNKNETLFETKNNDEFGTKELILRVENSKITLKYTRNPIIDTRPLRQKFTNFQSSDNPTIDEITDSLIQKATSNTELASKYSFTKITDVNLVGIKISNIDSDNDNFIVQANKELQKITDFPNTNIISTTNGSGAKTTHETIMKLKDDGTKTITDFKSDNVDIMVLFDVGYSIKELYDSGFTATDFKNGGFQLTQLINTYNVLSFNQGDDTNCYFSTYSDQRTGWRKRKGNKVIDYIHNKTGISKQSITNYDCAKEGDCDDYLPVDYDHTEWFGWLIGSEFSYDDINWYEIKEWIDKPGSQWYTNYFRIMISN